MQWQHLEIHLTDTPLRATLVRVPRLYLPAAVPISNICLVYTNEMQ